jgi:hypothetical protein
MQCQLIDICLGSFLTDHHNRPGELLLGVPVDGTTDRKEVLDGLLQELQARDIDSETFSYDEAKACIKSLFVEGYGTDLSGLFDASLDKPTDEELDESCQAWFLLTWTEGDPDSWAALKA